MEVARSEAGFTTACAMPRVEFRSLDIGLASFCLAILHQFAFDTCRIPAISPNRVLEMRDPNWLFSALAQCSAALIAIAGGYIASRLLRIGQARNHLLSERNRTRDELENCRTELRELEPRLLDECGRELAKRSIANIAGSFGEVTSLDLIADAQERSGRFDLWSADQLRGYVDPLIDVAREASRRFDEQRAEYPNFYKTMQMTGISAPPTLESLWIGETVPDLSELQIEVCELVIKKKWRETAPARDFLSPVREIAASLSSLPGQGTLDYIAGVLDEGAEYARLDSLRSLEVELQDELFRLDIEIGKLETPAKLNRVVAGFCVFLALGVIYPLILMSLDPVPTANWAKATAIAAFVAGIGAVALALSAQIRKDRIVPDQPLDRHLREPQ